MTDDACTEMELLTQAEIDGELGPADAARLAQHRESCPDCSLVAEQVAALSQAVRAGVPYHRAPAGLRRMLTAPPLPAVTPRRRRTGLVPFGAGLALAACLALLLLPRADGLTDAVVSGHARALQPGHMLDVQSSDQHTVKPWLDGKLDFAPPVRDLATAGFPLDGARLDYLGGHTVAALVYHRRQHPIDLYVWREAGDDGPRPLVRDGYNMVRWRAGGMAFWAISDLAAPELDEFVGLLRAP